MQKVLIVVVALLFGASLSFSQVNGEKTVLIGIAVDSHGKPVAGAIIIYSPGPWADIMTGAVADDFGRFELKIDGISDDNTLWITGPTYSETSNTRVQAGINLDPKYLSGKEPIHLKRDVASKIIDLGEVPILVSYTPIKMLFAAEDQRKYFNPDEDLWIRVVDKDGEIASDGTGGRGYNEKEGSFTVALPEGVWTIEISTDDEHWETVAKNLVVAGQKEIVINFCSKDDQ